MLTTFRSRIFCIPICYLKAKIKIYRNIILIVVLYGCKICLSYSGKNMGWRCLRIGYSRRYLVPKWRRVDKLHNEELCDICSSPQLLNWSNQEEWNGRCICQAWGEENCTHRFLRKHVGNRPLERTKRTWQDNIKMHFAEIKCRCEGLVSSDSE